MEPILLHTADVLALDDEELFRLCAANRDLHIERDRHGNLLIISPSGSNTSRRNSTLIRLLGNWNEATGLGVVFDASGGFVLPDGAMRAPDAAWIPQERWAQFTPEARERFLPLCPDFLVELRSPSDRLPELQAKLEDWMRNGCRLAWLIDPVEEQAFVYRAAAPPERLGTFAATLSGEDVLPDFELHLAALR